MNEEYPYKETERENQQGVDDREREDNEGKE